MCAPITNAAMFIFGVNFLQFQHVQQSLYLWYVLQKEVTWSAQNDQARLYR